MLKWLEIVEK